ncbi:cadherin repeat domain-containing protein [uncultured Draconibacterium sp.]|uniref:cadherin repeat domain-containing protein n=1 Tax=uncultured Draconibacterium sp. TaxID=1573823 RepID=UPI003216441A
MDWCVAGEYKGANHRPVVTIKGGLDRTVKSGETIVLEVDATDPDSVDVEALWERYSPMSDTEEMMYKQQFKNMLSMMPKCNIDWWQYKDAGTYDGMVRISGATVGSGTRKIEFEAPHVSKPETIHIVFEASDLGSPMLTSFARIIINVLPID